LARLAETRGEKHNHTDARVCFENTKVAVDELGSMTHWRYTGGPDQESNQRLMITKDFPPPCNQARHTNKFKELTCPLILNFTIDYRAQ